MTLSVRLVWIVVLLASWEAFARANAGSFVIAGPTSIAAYLFDNSGLVARATMATSSSAIQGFILGNIAAMAMAGAAILWPRCEKAITLFALLVFCLPLVATGPILRVLFGPGTGPQVTLAALAVYYTTYLALLVGLRAIPQSWSDLVAIYGRGRWAELVTARARASIPYLVAALQIAAPVAFLGAMVGEFTGADRGLGVLTLRAMRSLDVSATWSIAVVATSISMLVYGAIGALGRIWIHDQPDILLAPRRRAPDRSAKSRIAQACLFVTLALVMWYGLMAAFDLNRFFAKRPDDVVSFLVNSDASRMVLLGALAETLGLAIPGYLAGLALGASLAALLVLLPGLSNVVTPMAVALRSVPIITTAPLIVLALGRGPVGTITIVAVMIFFPTLVACLAGLRQVPGQIRDVFESYASGPIRYLLLAQVPAMLPAFFASARMAVPAALLAVTTAEWLATGRGIGNLMALTASTSDYNMLWSAIVVLSFVAMVWYLALEWVEQAVLRIYASEQVIR